MRLKIAPLIIFLILYLIIEVLPKYLPSKNGSPIVPSVSSRQNVLSVQTSANSQCHAIQVNTSDPQAYLPDPNCTPGSLNSAVTQDTVSSTICSPGYTKTIRPPAAYTSTLKKQQIAEYGYLDTNLSSYEEDHLISLELGGNPTDPKNLWPEPHASLNEKDKVENYLNRQICSGQMSLQEAQDKIRTNWYTVAVEQRFNY